MIKNAKIQEDGSLYFCIDGKPTGADYIGECVVEWDEERGEYILRNNDHFVAEV